MPAPRRHPNTPFADDGKACHRDDNWLWVPLRGRWVDVTHMPEEVVRQDWVRRLVVDGGFDLAQMGQEIRSLAHGRGSPRADIVVWPSAQAKVEGAAAWIVVETKAAASPVLEADFIQGRSYASVAQADFLICATATAHAVYELPPGIPAKAREINAWPVRSDFASEKRLRELRESLRVFDRAEFQRLLVVCHNLLRDAHAMSPDQAFDTISKILFIKLNVERSGFHGTFTTRIVDEFAKLPTGGTPYHEVLFNNTREAYEADGLFDDSPLGVSPATFREIVGKLQRFNLSQTGEDVKGIAFEQFLGRTFRGELGQFFTPRPVVNFIVDAVDPQEGELICDPAAGSGGFLIRAFDHVRDAIAADVTARKEEAVAAVYSEYDEDADEDALERRDARAEEVRVSLNAELAPFMNDGSPADTRVGRLARDCIYGTDKEARAARTAKMNMIMHGDGHGGIYWHDGLVDISGIWQGRFDVVVTNPPFGSTVKRSASVGDTDTTDVPNSPGYARRQQERYGDGWKVAHAAVKAARGTPVLDLYEVAGERGGAKTEVLFLERCLNLLKPGGRLAIVLPNGNLNGTSLAWLRRWAEGKALLRGVVSLPPETFRFSGASVSASVVMMRKFTAEDAQRWEQAWEAAEEAHDDRWNTERAAALASHRDLVLHGKDPRAKELLDQLRALDGDRVLPAPTVRHLDGVNRGVVSTTVMAPRLTGRARGPAATVRAALTARLNQVPAADQAMTELKAEMSRIDAAHGAALWAHVRESFDYPVFMARPEHVGITATGDTGEHVPDDLPEVLTAWREFVAEPTWGALR